jgi:triphosphoribosyl-dephospho-CoA synthase
MISQQQLREFYQQACELELQAFKPGNVSVYADGHDMTVADFRLSAKISAIPLCNLEYSLGERIFYSVKATYEAVGCNTNLGIILLCAPLIQAVNHLSSGLTLRQALHQVLITTTMDDAAWVFKAITLASPAGLGHSEKQDVKEKPTVTLTEAMRLASEKDRIALQYVTDYRDIFDLSVFMYYNGLSRWGNQKWAAVTVYADLLSQFPDSHIERKYGNQYSEMVTSKMALLSKELNRVDCPESIMPLLYYIDRELKSKGINPGTTADITVTTVFTVYLEELLALTKKSS